MRTSRPPSNSTLSDRSGLLLLAMGLFLLHMLTNGQYGFHRDELATIDDARHLAWGYVAYPPLTPILARISIELFGPSLVSVRLFAAVAQSAVLVLTGLMARELGGSTRAQLLAAVAAAISPSLLAQGALMQYVGFDVLWWVLIAYMLIRLLKSGDARWWLAVGAVIGIGMMTKFAIAFFAVALAGAVLLTDARRYLRSGWLWAGVVLALLIFLPNLIWQLQHDFISLSHLSYIHERDIEIGRTSGFLVDQLDDAAHLVTVPLWAAGLYYYLRRKEARPYRAIGWLYVLTLALFAVMQGRAYYMAGAYPMLLAGGAVAWDSWLASLTAGRRNVVAAVTWTAVVSGAVAMAPLSLPLTPVNSPIWNAANETSSNFREELGWEELVQTVAEVYHGLPEDERAEATIFAANYGEAGAINLYGPAYGLPEVISPVNSYWLRGPGSAGSAIVVLVGAPLEIVEPYFEDCKLAARVTNRFGVENEESSAYPGVLICRKLQRTWPEIWDEIRQFG